MVIQLKDTTAGLRSFSVEQTYGGMLEGTRGTCTKYLLKREKENEERDGYLFVETGYVKDHGLDALKDWHFKASFETWIDDEIYRLTVSFYGDAPEQEATICSLISEAVKNVSFNDNALHFDICDL